MDPTERRTRVTEEAADWWVRLRAQDPRREEREQFVDWLRESPVHVAEMLRIAQVHGAIESFERWTDIAIDGATDRAEVIALRAEDPNGDGAARRSWSKLWIGSLAAGVCALSIAVAWYATDYFGRTISTDRGERREVTLADGSVVQVSPESTLRVSLDEHERRITLERGAALFRVSKDARRPFVVEVDGALVRAVGTAFGVERRKRGVIVTVSEGRVEVKPHAIAKPARPFTLVAGEQIAVPRAGDAAMPLDIAQIEVRKVDSSRELAWAEGRLIFESEPIAEVIDEFNRYNRVQLYVTDESLARRPVSGVFDASDPESFIAFVETVASVRVLRQEDRSITLATP